MSAEGAHDVPAAAGESPPVPRGQAVRARLVEAGWTVFCEKPFDLVHVGEISARAGVSTGSFYSHFDSKESLFRVVAARALDELHAYPWRDPDNADGNPVRDIAYGVRHYFRTCQRLRIVARSIEQVMLDDGEVRVTRRGTLMRGAKRIERWVRALQDEDICDRDIDPWFTALSLQAMAVHLAYDQLVYRDQPQHVEPLVAAVTPIWARAVGLESWLRAL
ncbi:MAG TPA: TetR/AcrR family transcriptional regulator [Acidimicrobiales bacterium]|nr:TetR/AcrR family transcriptional regulator [Acidimicrobiales bacterium]